MCDKLVLRFLNDNRSGGSDGVLVVESIGLRFFSGFSSVIIVLIDLDRSFLHRHSCRLRFSLLLI